MLYSFVVSRSFTTIFTTVLTIPLQGVAGWVRERGRSSGAAASVGRGQGTPKLAAK